MLYLVIGRCALDFVELSKIYKRKRIIFVRMEKAQKTLEFLRGALIKVPVHSLPEESNEFKLSTDANSCVPRTILAQERKTIPYASKS